MLSAITFKLGYMEGLEERGGVITAWPYDREEPTQEELDLWKQEYAEATSYIGSRAAEYPSTEEQLDLLYHQGLAGWKTVIKAVKDKYPKPE